MRQLGDEALLFDVDGGHRKAQELARTFRAREVIPAATTVGVVGPFDRVPPSSVSSVRTSHEIEVALDPAALRELGLDPSSVAGELRDARLEAAWLGFMPGFAYLVGLPPSLSGLGRLATPRVRVPAGSLAVAHGYAGIYPAASPGGWNVIGRTAICLFDPVRPPHALLRPGDSVRFVPVAEVDELAPAGRPPLRGSDLEVVQPGPLLLVEDAGRQGVASLGVPRSGAANSCWQRVANLAVGNDERAAVLETVGLTRLRARREVLLALGGHAELLVDGTARSPGTVVVVGAGQEVAVGPVRSGARAVIALAGGVELESCLSSRSCDPVSGLPPGPLRAGDSIDLGRATGRARARFSLPDPGSPVVLRAIDGPDHLPPGTLGGSWTVGDEADRTGVRLRRPDGHEGLPRAVTSGQLSSHAVVPGAIQLTPSGQPVLLGPDCGPVGGYPVGATVISADLWRAGTLAPGDLVEVVSVSLGDAQQALSALQSEIAASVRGWYPKGFA